MRDSSKRDAKRVKNRYEIRVSGCEKINRADARYEYREAKRFKSESANMPPSSTLLKPRHSL